MELIQSKKAQVEESINWVFVLIAGAVILLFFAMLIYRFGGVSEAQTDVTIITNLNSILSGTELSSKFTTLISDMPLDSTAYFDCGGFTLGSSSNSYNQKIVFAPSELPLNPLRVWTIDWNMPYLVTNFIYLTSRQIQYVFIYDENSPASMALKSKIESLLPEDMNTRFLNDASGAFTCPTRYVFLDKDPANLQDKCAKSTAVKINSDYTLSYYAKSGDSFALDKTSIYFDDASLQATVIADNAEYYRCMMNKAFKRYTGISYVISERTESLKAKMPECASYYGNYAFELYSQLSANPDFETTNIKSIMTGMTEANRQLPLHSCPTIY